MVVFDPPVQVATITERTIKNFAVDGHLQHKARPKSDASWSEFPRHPRVRVEGTLRTTTYFGMEASQSMLYYNT